jgi:hypothetical protein
MKGLVLIYFSKKPLIIFETPYLNIRQFVYFYTVDSDLKSDLKIAKNYSSIYLDNLESFKQYLRDKNYTNYNLATYNTSTGIYYINGVDYEYDNTLKTFK